MVRQLSNAGEMMFPNLTIYTMRLVAVAIAFLITQNNFCLAVFAAEQEAAGVLADPASTVSGGRTGTAASAVNSTTTTGTSGSSTAPGIAAPPPSKARRVAFPVTSEYLLGNGLRVIFSEDHSFPVISCLTWYRVGSRNEAAGATGITHLLEHLLFGKVGSFRKGEIGTTVARVGGEFNGYTSDDFTAFFETLPTQKLELALRIESQRMRGGVFTDADVQEEVANIQTEFENESRDGLGTLHREVRAALYQQHPYRHPTLGLRNDLENLNACQVKSYYDKFFWPNNCTIVIAGDVQPKSALVQIQKYFGVIPASLTRVPNPHFVEPAQVAERRIVVKYPGRQEILDVAYHAPAFDDADAPAMVVLEKLLNAAYAGRLKTRLVDQKICASALASYESKKDPGYFNIDCISIPGTAGAQQKILDGFDGIVAQLRTQPVSDAELKRARNQAEFSFYVEQEGPYRAGFHLGYFDSLSRWQNTYSWAEKLRAVSAVDVQRVAKKYLNPESRVVAWLAGSAAVKPAITKPADSPTVPQHTSPAKQFEHARLTGYKSDDAALKPAAKKTVLVAKSIAKPAAAVTATSKRDVADQGDAVEKPKPAAARQGKVVRDAIREIPSALPAAVKDIPAVLGGAPAAIKEIPAAVNAVPAVIKNIPSAIGGLPSAVKEIPSALGSIPSAIKQIPGAIGGIPGAAATAVKDLPGAIGGLPGTAASTIKELPAAIGSLPGAAASAIKGMPSALGSFAVELGGIPGAIGKQLAPGALRADHMSQHVVKRVLKNGLTLLIFESHLSPIVQIDGAVRAGSLYEAPAKKGLSALSAAILNMGTAQRNRMQILTQQEDLGLQDPYILRFDPGADTITFRTACLARDLPDQLNLIGEALYSPALGDNEIERAKQEALSILRQREDSPNNRVNRALVRSLLAQGSAFVPPEPNDVGRYMPALSGADARKFFRDYVVPKAATIVLAGDIDPDAAVAMAERAFGDWSGKGAHQRLGAHANAKHVVRTALPSRDKAKTTICFGQLVPVAKTGPEYGSLLIADGILSSHPVASRLGQKLTTEPALSRALSDEPIETRMDPLANSVAWSFTVSVEPNAVPLTVQSLQTELKRLANTGVTADEVFESKRYLLGAIPVRSFSTLSSTAKTLLDAAVHTEEGENYWSVINSLRIANVDSVNRVIKTALKPEQATMVILGSAQSIRSVRNQVASGAVDHRADVRKADSVTGAASDTADKGRHSDGE